MFSFSCDFIMVTSRRRHNCVNENNNDENNASATETLISLARMSVLDTEVDGSNPGSSMLFP